MIKNVKIQRKKKILREGLNVGIKRVEVFGMCEEVGWEKEILEILEKVA